MPKRKVGELFGVPVVMGDRNLITENEILLEKFRMQIIEGGILNGPDMGEMMSINDRFPEDTLPSTGTVTITESIYLFKRDSFGNLVCISAGMWTDSEVRPGGDDLVDEIIHY